jgi:hypothetical protein
MTLSVISPPTIAALRKALPRLTSKAAWTLGRRSMVHLRGDVNPTHCAKFERLGCRGNNRAGTFSAFGPARLVCRRKPRTRRA